MSELKVSKSNPTKSSSTHRYHHVFPSPSCLSRSRFAIVIVRVLLGIRLSCASYHISSLPIFIVLAFLVRSAVYCRAFVYCNAIDLKKLLFVLYADVVWLCKCCWCCRCCHCGSMSDLVWSGLVCSVRACVCVCLHLCVYVCASWCVRHLPRNLRSKRSMWPWLMG